MDRKSAVFIGMGVELVGIVLVLVYIGRYFDTEHGWGGLGAALGAMLGLIGWVIHLFAIVRQLAKKNESSHTDAQ